MILSDKNIGFKLKRSNTKLIIYLFGLTLLVNGLLFVATAHAYWDTDFYQLPIDSTFGSKNEPVKNSERFNLFNIWTTKGNADIEVPTALDDPNLFSNRFPGQLRFEFMDYFLFPENYTIEIFKKYQKIDNKLIETLKNRKVNIDNKGKELHYVVTEHGELVLGAGEGKELSHSQLANYSEDMEDFDAVRKKEFLLESPAEGGELTNLRIKTGGTLYYHNKELIVTNHTGHFQATKESLEKNENIFSDLSDVLYNEHGLEINEIRLWVCD